MSWTLRPQRTWRIRQGYKQEHEAALRASRYTRRHAWQFHGAGAEEAVQKLTGLKEFSDTVRNMRVGLAKLSEALNKPITNDGAAVVGWRSPSGLLLCLKHPHREAVQVTADDLPEGGICVRCGVDVLIPVVP